MEPIFFATAAELREWFVQNHETSKELIVGYYKRGTGRPSPTWAESVDEALCFGWIDGVRHSLDEERYTNRFTPRRARSNWSAINVARVAELIKEGRMTPAGLAAFEQRAEARTGIYAYEQRDKAAFDEGQEREFRANAGAWEYFSSQPPWYRKTATWWVVSAKREDTRRRRLTTLINDSAQGKTIGPLTR